MIFTILAHWQMKVERGRNTSVFMENKDAHLFLLMLILIQSEDLRMVAYDKPITLVHILRINWERHRVRQDQPRRKC